ncbi:PREDICTED: 11-beta-hydroxysteroid dehydrogenase-like 5 [Nicotiana attenuata]|uniref:11-beta-hydroxysteroid dehydrogenase-like 5 n=1 Tax=Nicotiana attenuata TaxID=49451 RepID=A0A314LGD7_NICAT|nr:PREDICTED: 11-beta-hydroxysteroid dehydrogenase-like 5 [Nicotiana attenuata]OIT40622.1 11-beta-hydroxysteroid dehydrogenase-like 5 [Nicotiana attenuata]
MDLVNSVLNVVVPPASLVMLAFAWPALTFINTCEWLYNSFFGEDMEDKVVIITGASSGIGEQIAYEYAKRKAHLVLVARRENRLWGISENARGLGAKSVLITAADVVKEADCRRFITETVNLYGRVDHLVNTASLGHTFYLEEATDTNVFPILMDINFWGNVYPTYVALPYLRQNKGRVIVNASVESWLPLPRMSLYSAAKAALVNFYETLRFEVNGDVGVTIATHGWIGTEMTGGRFMLEEGAEMQWKEEREVHASGSSVEDFAKLIVSGACRGDPYVKYPSWHDIFLLYRVFTPNVLQWTFRMVLADQGARRTSFIGTGRPLLESTSPRRQPLPESTSPRRQPLTESSSPRRQPLLEPTSSPRRRVGPVPVQQQIE